ncbi:GL11992 [Drosophila persimilis]|uniref:GL11992 n=1 Tax=Drosophila persimilis TaxID=7234 RepID=B4GLP8_DROPE|nr:GL11992 [Drosophila persimilis]
MAGIKKDHQKDTSAARHSGANVPSNGAFLCRDTRSCTSSLATLSVSGSTSAAPAIPSQITSRAPSSAAANLFEIETLQIDDEQNQSRR